MPSEDIRSNDEDPDRLSFIHAVRVIRRKIQAPAAFPPRRRQAAHDALLAEILDERLAPRRGRHNPRSVKRKMSNFPLRRRGDPFAIAAKLPAVIRIIK